MPKTWKLALLGVAAFIVFLIASFPADLALRWFAPSMPGVNTGFVEGTIWNGVARNAGYRQMVAEEIRWDLHPLSLFAGSVSADVAVKLPRGNIKASLHQDLGGDTVIENLQGSLPLAQAAALGIMPRNIAEGEILLNIERLELVNGKPVAANGRIGLANLESALLRGVSLGSYQADIATQEESITATFTDVDAPIRVQGSFTLQSGQYSVDAKMLPAEGASPQIANGLKLLGQPDASGRYSFRTSGRL